MSSSGDEKKNIDVKASLEALKQQKREQTAQETYKPEQAAKQGTETGKKTRDISDSTLKLTKFLKDANIVQTSDARSLALRQDTANNALTDTIKTVEGNTYQQGSRKPYYTLSDGTPITNAMVDQWKRDLSDGKANLKKINKAVKQGEINKTEYNNYIRELEKRSLEPKLTKAYTYKTSPPTKQKLPTGAIQGPPKPTTYNSRVAKQTGFFNDLIGADIKNDKKREETIKAFSPLYAQTVGTGEDAGGKLVKAVDLKIRNYEKMADYATPLGIDELTGPNRKENINKLKARFAHMTLATDKAFIASVPVIALSAAGGPVTVGLVAAVGVASMINPANRAELDKFVQAHPQEFMASLGGALLAGVTVAEVSKAFKLHTKNMKIAERQKLTAQYDKIIDDYAYLEQRKGAEFPSRAIEIPEQYGKKIIVSNPIDPEAQIFENFLMELSQKNEGQAVQSFFKNMKENNMAMYVDMGGGQLESVTVESLLNKYNGLREPYYNPAFSDPSILNKADLVARSNNPGVNYSPLLAAALVQAAKQGYITETQIKELISMNQVSLKALKSAGITIPRDFSITEVKNLDLNDIISIAVPTQVSGQVPVSVVAEVPITDIPIPTPPIPEVIIPEPIEPIYPIIAGKFTPKQISETRRQVRGFEPVSKYRVTIDGKPVTVDARGYPDAVQKALRQRGAKKKLPKVIEAERIR